MKTKYAALIAATMLVSAPLMAQAPAAAPAKPTLMGRMLAPVRAKPAPATPVAKPAAAAARAPSASKGQAPRTAKSLDCSKQADAKNIHGQARKTFMSRCKKT